MELDQPMLPRMLSSGQAHAAGSGLQQQLSPAQLAPARSSMRGIGSDCKLPTPAFAPTMCACMLSHPLTAAWGAWDELAKCPQGSWASSLSFPF
jgi:hypothetical protein